MFRLLPAALDAILEYSLLDLSCMAVRRAFAVVLEGGLALASNLFFRRSFSLITMSIYLHSSLFACARLGISSISARC